MASKKFSAEYECGEVLGLYTTRSADGDEGRLRQLATKFRQLCRLEREPKIPAEYKAITPDMRTPFCRDAWHRITSSLVAKPPISHITPKDDDNKDYRDAANTAERWDLALIERLNKEQGTDIVYDATAALVRDGESVIKVVHRPDAWANFPERADRQTAGEYTRKAEEYKRGTDLPIAWRVVDRLSIVYEGGEYGDEWVLEYGEYSRPYLKRRYAMAESESKLVDPKRSLEGKPQPEGLLSSSTGRSVKVEFFDAREWHVIIDGSEAPGFPKRNPYAPYLPYFRAPAYDMESLLYSLLFLVPRLDDLLTAKLNWAILGAYPNPVLETVPNQSGLPALDGPLGNVGDVAGASVPGQAVTWTPGKMMDLPLGKRLTFLSPPPVGKDLNDLIGLIKSMIDIAGVPSIMRGMSGAGDSGYLANQQRAAAEMAYKLAALSGQRQLEKAMEFSHWLVSNVVKQTVYVLGWDSINPKTGKPANKAGRAWLGLSPDSQTKNIADVSKLGPVSFQFRVSLPTDEQARAMIALQLTNAEKPLYDVRHALETWMQEEDPESIIEAIAVEQALNEEPLRSMVIEEALRGAGINVPKPPNPAAALVGPDGVTPLIGGPMSPGMQGVPLANQAPPGMPGVPGLTMPLTPQAPQAPAGIPGAVGGRRPGMYPGQPGGPQQ